MFRFKKVLLLISTAVVLVVSGCGDGGSDSSSSSSPPPSPSPAPSPSPSPTACATWSYLCGYEQGDVVRHNGRTYTALVQHSLTAEASGWTPDTTTALWSAGGTWTGSVSATRRKYAQTDSGWTEHWFEHVQDLTLIAYNDTIALYFDNDVNRSAGKWMVPYLTRLWQYAQRTYRLDNNNRLNVPADRDDRLYSIHHQNRYSGGHPAVIYDGGVRDHDYRNVSDVGTNGDWLNAANNYEVATHETAHVVEIIGTGYKGSPAFPLWGDSKWAEFYIYDVYVGLGMTSEAQAFYNRMAADSHVDAYPVANSHWFRDWFYPLWRDHGGAHVMVNYFRLLGQHYVRKTTDGDTANDHEFSRNLNWGEYVHFMSGAAGQDLRALAGQAFGGWSATWETQFQQARVSFPAVSYPLAP